MQASQLLTKQNQTVCAIRQCPWQSASKLPEFYAKKIQIVYACANNPLKSLIKSESTYKVESLYPGPSNTSALIAFNLLFPNSLQNDRIEMH